MREGVEILKMVPEYCLTDVEFSADQPVLAAAAGPLAIDTDWLVNMRDLENKVEAGRQERQRQFAPGSHRGVGGCLAP